MDYFFPFHYYFNLGFEVIICFHWPCNISDCLLIYTRLNNPGKTPFPHPSMKGHIIKKKQRIIISIMHFNHIFTLILIDVNFSSKILNGTNGQLKETERPDFKSHQTLMIIKQPWKYICDISKHHRYIFIIFLNLFLACFDM